MVKVIPIHQGAKNRVEEHGEEMELLLDEPDSFMVRSLKQTWKDGETFWKWIGTFNKEEARWEEAL